MSSLLDILAFLCYVVNLGILVFIARLLVRISASVEEDNARGNEHTKLIQEIVKDQGSNTRAIDLLHRAMSAELDIIHTAIRQGQTGPMTLRMERLERERAGDEMPTLKQRQARTVEENHQVKESMRGQ